MNALCPAPNATSGESPVKQSLRVLCVEDDDGDFALLNHHLRSAPAPQSLSLERVPRLGDALRRLEADHPDGQVDVVLLDLSLPDSCGLPTYHDIRAAAPHVAITILSGNSDEELALQMVHLGAQDYIPKDTLTGDVLRRSIIYSSQRQRLLTDLRHLNEQLLKIQEDLKSTQMQLVQAEKLDSLGRVAASVAHELKNPLGTLQVGVDYFGLRGSTLGEHGGRMLACMQDAVERAEGIINEMLDFSRSEKLTIRPCPVNEIVSSALRMIAHELVERKVHVNTAYCDAAPSVRADWGKMEQVLMNLIINSAQAMPGGGEIEVTTSVGILEDHAREEGLREMDLLKAGDEVVFIEVRDHGHGIPADITQRIFEPFFTTKPPGEGTGLGLPVAKRIVELHRSRLALQNADPPPGAVARITLRRYFPDQDSGDPHASATTHNQ